MTARRIITKINWHSQLTWFIVIGTVTGIGSFTTLCVWIPLFWWVIPTSIIACALGSALAGLADWIRKKKGLAAETLMLLILAIVLLMIVVILAWVF